MTHPETKPQAPTDTSTGSGRGSGRGSGTGSNKARLLRFLPLGGLLVALLVAVFVFDAGRFLSFAAISENHDRLTNWSESNPFAAPIFVFVYALTVALSIPGATFLTLTGGLLFGLFFGTAIVALGATIGAVLVFLAARTAFAESLAKRASGKVEALRDGFSANAFSYLLFLRLVPLFPFWLVNIVPAVLGMRLAPYGLATFLGILPGTAVYVSVGNGLGAILSTGDEPNLSIIFAPQVLLPLLALAVLSLVPIVVKRVRGKPQEQD